MKKRYNYRKFGHIFKRGHNYRLMLLYPLKEWEAEISELNA